MPTDPEKKPAARITGDPTRVLVLIVSLVFCVIGIVGGGRTGWMITGFFGLCFIVALFEHRLPKPWLESEFRLVFTGDEIVCEFRKRKRESIRWEYVVRIWYLTTGEGPHVPDEWIVFEGEQGGCAVPTEAQGFRAIWSELERRFPGFDYGPVIRGGTTLARHLCWERRRATGS